MPKLLIAALVAIVILIGPTYVTFTYLLMQCRAVHPDWQPVQCATAITGLK